jgi:hypothetical protein
MGARRKIYYRSFRQYVPQDQPFTLMDGPDITSYQNWTLNMQLSSMSDILLILNQMSIQTMWNHIGDAAKQNLKELTVLGGTCQHPILMNSYGVNDLGRQ